MIWVSSCGFLLNCKCSSGKEKAMKPTIEIDQQTQELLVGAFASATELVLRELARTESVLESAEWRTEEPWRGELAALIDLKSATVAELMLCMPVAVAENLARRLLAETGVVVDAEMVRDCLGETANGIAGQAKALLHGSAAQMTFSTPRIVEADEAKGGGWLVLRYGSEVGALAVQVRLCGR